jgi:hypothetical protein
MIKFSTKNICYLKGANYENSIHLLTLGAIWLLSAFVSTIKEYNISILLLFLGVTLFKPITKIIRKLLALCPLSDEDPIKMLNTCIAIGIPIGLIVGFFPFVENINMFFPIFTVLFGILFGIVAYIFQIKTFATLSFILIAGGIYIGYYYPENFPASGYFTAIVLMSSGIVSRIASLIEIYILKRNKIIIKIGKITLPNARVS